MVSKLEKPLYHGTSYAAARIIASEGFRSPVYLCEDRNQAEHYAKAATAYVEEELKEHLTESMLGYSIITIKSVPDINKLLVDDYNLEAEKGQMKYIGKLTGWSHFTIERFPLNESSEQRLYLKCFAIGMCRG